MISGTNQDDDAGFDSGSAYAYVVEEDDYPTLCSGDGGTAPGCTDCPCASGSGIASPFFDGLRCIGGDGVRHGVRITDLSGDSTNPWGPPSANPPGGLLVQSGFCTIGQTRYFQVVYRDDFAAQCGTGQNTSNAIEVVVMP